MWVRSGFGEGMRQATRSTRSAARLDSLGAERGGRGAPRAGHHPEVLVTRIKPLVLVDAENVRRSTWPNVGPEELVHLVGRWSEAKGLSARIVFDGRAPAGAVGTENETADDLIAREAGELTERGERYWLVTSDRGLRARAGPGAEQVVGGGAFVRELLALDG